MKIDCGTAYPFGEVTYQISINEKDDIEAEDIAECFNAQYPKVKCVVVSSKQTVSIEMKFIIVGIKMKEAKE